ncbi:hypothetical protein V6K52_00975 [Knoellia sp. S7-12]|uniref:hypothetical protein n=1 Tax=Knoellia sp. S7-12 TaxID=3126698 RepID=UPI003369948B
MSDPRHPNRPDRPRSRVVLALAATFGLVLSLAQGVAGPASATSLPTPTSLTVRAYTDPAVIAEHLAGAPAEAIPAVLAATDDTFLIAVTLKASTADAAYKQDQVVNFTATGPGSLTLTRGTIPRGTTTSVFTVAYSAVATGIRISASVGKGAQAIGNTSNAFDINRFLTFVPGTAASLRDGTAGADGAGCAVVDQANPLCGIVILPNGASGDVALTLGACPTGEACGRGSFVTQMIADLTAGGANLYDRRNPARMELICDKTLCGKAGVPSFTALWSETAFGSLEPVSACASKGVIDAGLDYCTDYRSSRRDGAGDLHLIVLFVRDVRGGI